MGFSDCRMTEPVSLKNSKLFISRMLKSTPHCSRYSPHPRNPGQTTELGQMQKRLNAFIFFRYFHIFEYRLKTIWNLDLKEWKNRNSENKRKY